MRVSPQLVHLYHFHKRNHHGPPPNTWNKRFFLCIGFVHVQISDIWSNVQGFEHMGLPWRYNGQCEWRLEYWACYMLLERCLNHWWAFQSLFWLSKLPSNHSATLTTPLYAIISIFDSWYQQFALKKTIYKTRYKYFRSDIMYVQNWRVCELLKCILVIQNN